MKQIMKQIIINADDFGINEVATTEIERMIKMRAISSTTVMANGLCLDEVKRFASLHPEISFGVHLCLSEFGSLTNSDGLRKLGLIDDNGKFVYKSIFKVSGFSEEAIVSIRDELNAQIDVVSSLGFPLSHADSHHHVHTIYALRKVFADVLQKRGITKVRLGFDFNNWRSRRHISLWVRRVKLNNYYSSRFVTTNAFYSYADFVKSGTRRGEQVVELMCHPGNSGQHFQHEIELVEAKEALNRDDTTLISYNDLH